MENKMPPFYEDKNAETAPDRKIMGAVLLGIILIWFAFQYRSNSFFTHEGISLGMTPAQVEQALPDAGNFRKVKFIDHRSGDVLNFEMLEAKVQPLPWQRLFIVAIDDEIVGISAYTSDVTKEQVDEIRDKAISLYGVPDDNFKSKYFESEYGSETLVWGDVIFDSTDVMQGIEKINGRAIIYRFGNSGSVNVYVTRDGKGPRMFF